MDFTRAHSITGTGAVSAAGFGVAETASTVFDGAAKTRVNPARPEYLELQPDADWFARFDFPPHGLKPTLLAIAAIEEALHDAGLSFAQVRSKRVGLCLGTTMGGTNYNSEFNRAYFKGEKPDAGPLFEYLHSNSAQWIARRFDWRGPTLLVNNACTSGADAIGIGRGWLDAGLCDIAICGGTEAIVPKIYYGFRSLQLCAPTLCAPFDRDRQGLTLGEGAGIVVLEPHDSPRVSKARLLGYGSASDALHPTSPHPEGRGLEIAVRHATRDFEIAAVDFINAHGTATPHNDLAEGRWIARHCPTACTVATKGYTGHTLGAAGALEAVFTILSLTRGQLPATRGFRTMDPEIGVSPTAVTETGDYRIALSFSLGFGGINSVLALGKAP